MSIVLAADYRVRDFDHWSSLIGATLEDLHSLSAHHLVIYRSVDDPNRVFVTVGIRQRGPLTALLRSARFMEWFDTAGVDDIPSVFAGQIREKLDLVEGSAAPASVIVAGIVQLDDPQRWQETLHASTDGLRASGVLRVWTYQALDDERELMVLQEVDTERHAKRWLTHRDEAAQWLAGAGIGVYPPLFIGNLFHVAEVPTAS
jgi:hypothetical protein